MKNINVIKSSKEYIDDFLPTLSNFCSKCPLQPTVDYVQNEGMIYITPSLGNQITVVVNPTVDKHDVIRDVKNEMYKNYPIISCVEENSLSSEEIEKLIDDGMSVKEALEKKTYNTIDMYKVIRVHHIMFPAPSMIFCRAHKILPDIWRWLNGKRFFKQETIAQVGMHHAWRPHL